MSDPEANFANTQGIGGSMTSKKAIGALAAGIASLLVLTGCVVTGETSPIFSFDKPRNLFEPHQIDQQAKAEPFGETKSLYSAPTNIAEFIEIAQSATLHVFCETEDKEFPSAGSGFHLEIGNDRYIITNAHVIDDCLDEAGELLVYDSDNNEHEVELLAYRHVRDWRGDWDVAVLTGKDFGRAITIASDDPEPGHWSLVAGWPAMNGHWYQQVSPGNILGLSPDGVIISGGVTAPGMSGGPLLNSRGELIGIHYARSYDETRRALAQPVANLCQVAFVCGSERRPSLPLKFPERPITTFLEIED